MKEGLTYLMVTMAYHLSYYGLLECDGTWLIYWEANEWGFRATIYGFVGHHHHGVDHVLHCKTQDMISSSYP